MAKVNVEMTGRVAKRIRGLTFGGVRALDFTEEDKFPPVDDPGALSYFFAVTMHDYGFWIGDEKGYVKPLYGEVDGKKLKGSDLLWTLSMRIYREKGPEFFKPENLAILNQGNFYWWISKEFGFQDMITRWYITLNYGSYCVHAFTSPWTIVNNSNQYPATLQRFIELTSTVPGYNQDKLLKKNLLLAMILANRPERFLKVGGDERWPPIVDYHLMRVSLRLGLLDLTSQEHDMLSRRIWVSADTESSVRLAVYEAISMVIELSGKPMSELDFILWSARKYCPEMEAPDCVKCVFDNVCAKRVELFQPVFRTTNY